jgi:hypothetical protein
LELRTNGHQGGIGAALGSAAIAPTLLWKVLREKGYVLSNYHWWSFAPYFVVGTLAFAAAGFLLVIITTLLAAPVALLVRGWMRVVDPLLVDHGGMDRDFRDEEVAPADSRSSNDSCA